LFIAMSPLVDLPNVAQLSERVTRVLGLNPGPFTLQGTNTYIIGQSSRRILIDTGEDKEGYIPLLKQTLGTAIIDRVLLTHWHRDHVGGLGSVCQAFPNLNRTAYKYPDPVHDGREATSTRPGVKPLPGTVGHKLIPLDDGDIIQVDEHCTVRVLHTPGHTDDHLAFYLEEERALFTGDCVLGQGPAIFEDLPTYMASLERLRDMNAHRLYPGHGPVIEGEEAVRRHLDQYIEHRLQREREILEWLAKSPSPNDDGTWTARQLVAGIYQGYPEAVLRAAERTILLHLLKLKQEGRVYTMPVSRSSTQQMLRQTRVDPSEMVELAEVRWSLTNTVDRQSTPANENTTDWVPPKC
jgi:ribonuclease/clavin/mitogillin